VHASDLFTTFARVAQADKYIPRDRVIDGIDQTPLLFNGQNHGRRDYVYVYQNEVLRAIVKQEWKMHMPVPGMPAAAAGTYNVYRDPRELHPLIGHSLWTGASFQDMAVRHMMAIRKYPHNKLGKGKPYEGIENLRPETVETINTFMSWR
jgi:arylsulfatase